MKQHKIIQWAAILGALAIGAYFIWNFEGESRPAVQPKAAEAKAPASLPEPSPVALAAPSASTARKELPDSLRAKLATLQGISNEDFYNNRMKRMEELQLFVQDISLADMPAVLEQLQELQSQNPTLAGHDLGMRLLRLWSAQGATRETAEWALQMPKDERDEALAAAVDTWAQKDPSAAAAWAGQLPEGSGRRSALLSIVDEQVFSNPVEAIKLASTMPQDAERDALMMRGVSQWSNQAPDDALAWANQLPAGALHDQALSAIAISLSNYDLMAAADLALNKLPSGPLQDMPVVAIVQRWAMRDPEGAAKWVEQFPEGKLRTLATQVMNDTIKRTGQANKGQ